MKLVSGVPQRGTKKRGYAQKHNWLVIKREYISDPTVSVRDLAKKHIVPLPSLQKRVGEEKWTLLREEVHTRAELALTKEAESDVLEVKKRHVRIARLMQKIGIEALEKHKYLPKSSKEAREFVVEGVKMEKQAMGMDDKKPMPALIGIVQAQKEIIGQYQEAEIVSNEEES